MALRKAGDVPEDAVELSEIEATAYSWDLVTEWASISDTWALRYGPIVLGGINAFSGIMINRHFRHKLKLGTYGYLSSVIPITVMPAILTALFHRHSVSTGMLLMKDTCPVCYEIRSSAIQIGLGTVYPMVLGPASAMMFAHRYNTYRLPDLQEGPKVLFKFLRKISKPFYGTLATLFATQFIASSVITYFEMRNHMTMRRKIVAIENQILREQGLQD